MRNLNDKACQALDGAEIQQNLLVLMNEMPGGFFIYNAHGHEDILYVNDAMLRICGCSDISEFMELTGGTFSGLVHPDDIDSVKKSIWEQIKLSQYDLNYVEYRIVRKDGQVRWLEDHGHFVHSREFGDIFYVFASDATEKKRRHQREKDALIYENDRKDRQIQLYGLEYSRRQELIEGLSIDYASIFYVELNENRIHGYRLSRNTKMFFNRTSPCRDYRGFVQAYVYRWVHPEDRAMMTNFLNPDYLREQLSGRRMINTNFRIRCDNRTEYLQIRVVSVGKTAQASQIVIGLRSVDEEIRNAMEQQEILTDALRQAKSAVAAKNSFLSNMSHDMRTPLNAIAGFTELARRSVGASEKILHYLEMIEVSSTQLLGLISNVLEIARLESGVELLSLGRCDLREVAAWVEETLSGQAAAKQITLRLELDGLTRPVVWGDLHRLEEILFHLCSNGIEYTSPGGHVIVRMTEHSESDFGAYQIVVEDDGIGISRDFLDHIFEFFSREQNTTHSGIHGTGLGLPIVKSFTELMGGTIDVASEPGKGSRFTITLPLSPWLEDAVEPDGLGASSAPSESGGSIASGEPETPAPVMIPSGERKILVVDDNDLNIEISMELLQDAGFDVESANDGSVAVERIKQSKPGEFAFILMDIQMPVMDGYSAARAIRELPDPYLSTIPIVALSANTFEEDIRHSLESGMDAHLPKPIDMEPLLALIEKLTGLRP